MTNWVALDILMFVLAAVVVNAVMYLIGYYGKGKRGMYKWNQYLPPGFLIGLVWIMIFASLGYCFYLCYSGAPTEDYADNPKRWGVATYAILAVASYCLLYPILTMFVKDHYVPILNMIALVLAYVLGILVIREYVAAFWYVLPLIIWTTYVCLSDLLQYKDTLNKVYGSSSAPLATISPRASPRRKAM